MTQEFPLMAGRRGLVLGVANDHSIAWGIARTLAAHGARLAFTYQNEAFAKRVIPLAESVGAEMTVPLDVEDETATEAAFRDLASMWDSLDFVIHSLAYSNREELTGLYADTSRANFLRTMDISCFSFTRIARLAAPMMTAGGSLLTLTYAGAERVMPHYNVMGVAKAALEASVRYLAVDLGGQDIRVNAISAGPMRTLAGSAIGDARQILKWSHDHSALGRNVELDELGAAALHLLGGLAGAGAGAVTGEVLHVDSGYSIVGVPGLPLARS